MKRLLVLALVSAVLLNAGPIMADDGFYVIVVGGGVRIKNFIPVPLVRQGTGYTCGVSSLQSVFAYYGLDYRDDDLREALGTTPDKGTDYKAMLKVAEENGFQAKAITFPNMTLDHLLGFLNQKTPVILAIQAWPVPPSTDWLNLWEDGHYVVAMGYDQNNIYFMDPATIGNYTYIPIPEFLNRWHDEDQDGVKVINLGIVIDGKPPIYNPKITKPMN